ncbi:rCG23325 [Rattus norvegicus]|uniref:RCG23325 n=1 Tax=Rattus norvegicus TaxID=10116 RepID=A6JQ31_RAT|nr:rCG23325 [Rattus norvegicus]
MHMDLPFNSSSTLKSDLLGSFREVGKI